MGNFTVVYLFHVAATLAMAGLCWFVQVVHYPLFAAVGTDDFARYEQAHTQRTGWVVAPLMLAELGSGLALLAMTWAQGESRGLLQDTPSALTWLWISMALLAAIWLSTFFVQVPLHGLLSSGFDSDAVTRLTRTNWVRTLLWTLRGFILLALLNTTLAAPRDAAASSMQ